MRSLWTSLITYIMFHDYHTMFWATERLDTSRNDAEAEGRQITQVLAKFFMEIFDKKVKFLKSDDGQHRYTCYITSFCNAHSIYHNFPVVPENPGTSAITKQAMRNLFLECENNFTEVQIALSSLRDSGSKTRPSASYSIFYEEKEEVIWNPTNFDHDFLEVTYGQLSLMKSKMEQQILAITNALKAKNNNSANFKLDYPKILPIKEKSIKSQIQNGFMKAFELIAKRGEEENESKLLNTGAIKKVKINYTSHKQERKMDVCHSSPLSVLNKTEVSDEETEDVLKEIWGVEKKKEMHRRQLCLFCCKSKPPEVSQATHAASCTGTMVVCSNCHKDGHVSLACLKKPAWIRKSYDEAVSSPFQEHRLANNTELVRRGLRHTDFDRLRGAEKALAMTSRGCCTHCGKPECVDFDQCPAQYAKCKYCNQLGHYSRLCLMGEGRTSLTSHMTPAQLRLTPRRVIYELSKVKAVGFEEDEQEIVSDESVCS
jgi:hypothetical protein